jgi:hypothetical protein
MWNKYWLAYSEALVLRGVFDEVIHSALPVGHSHDDYGEFYLIPHCLHLRSCAGSDHALCMLILTFQIELVRLCGLS